MGIELVPKIGNLYLGVILLYNRYNAGDKC